MCALLLPVFILSIAAAFRNAGSAKVQRENLPENHIRKCKSSEATNECVPLPYPDEGRRTVKTRGLYRKVPAGSPLPEEEQHTSCVCVRMCASARVVVCA